MSALPNDKAIAQLLGAALRRQVKASAINLPPPAEMATGGLFVDSQDKLIGGLLANLPLVSHAGAALSLIPADAARDAIKARELDEIMRDNFAELMNMCSGLFNLARTNRVRLSATSFAPPALPAELAALAANPTERLDLEVDVEGYGKGRMILLLAP